MKRLRRERLFGVCDTNFMTQNTVIIENWNTYVKA